MGVRFSKDIEQENLEKDKTKWEHYAGVSLVNALHQAKEMGWKEKKVQVRYEVVDGIETYYVEPYEQGCGCKGMLKYRDYFD